MAAPPFAGTEHQQFLLARHEHEEGNDNQHRPLGAAAQKHHQETAKPHQGSHDGTDDHRHLRCWNVAHHRRQQRPQNATAVHRKHRQHVEEHQHHIPHQQQKDHLPNKVLIGSQQFDGKQVRVGFQDQRCWNHQERMAITTLTAGPATVIQNSSQARSLMRASRATPPIGYSLDVERLNPKEPAPSERGRIRAATHT